MSEDLFTKAMAKAYEQHPGAKVSSNFCWSLFKDGSETKDAEIERLKDEHESLMGRFRVYVHNSKKLINELADTLDKANNTLLFSVSVDALIKQAREATKDE